MKKLIPFLIALSSIITSKGQCLNADSLNTSNITYINAQANWSAAPSAHHYLIHYREIGTTIWNNVGNIDSTMTSRNIPQLQPQTTYEWQIKTFCDSTNQPNSGWSQSDTFTTTSFIPAAFDPEVTAIIGNTICGETTSFAIIASQDQNEPDIASTVFSSDKGSFRINDISSDDTLGTASYSSSFLNFTSTIVVDFTLGPNYAKIDLIDSIGDLMGFFIIENTTSGVRVSSLGPNDGNNYTNGYISQINFTDLFVNPAEEGPLTFTSVLDSELGDSKTITDASNVITCPPTSIKSSIQDSKLIGIYDILGRPAKIKKNILLIYLYENGSTTKKVIY